jgi:Raf kinase inhibitor-like YbhB/YbcL family protein
VLRRLALVLLALALLSGACSGSKHEKSAPVETVPAPAASLQVTSSAFTDGGAIPKEFTCDGANESPPLAWTGVPAGTASLALRMQDIDTPTKFVHWLVYNINPATTSLAAGQAPPDSVQAPNSFNKPGYGGPCPPAGSRHRYVLTLLALQTQLTISDTNLSPTDVWSTLENSAVSAKGELTGTYQRGV